MFFFSFISFRHTRGHLSSSLNSLPPGPVSTLRPLIWPRWRHFASSPAPLKKRQSGHQGSCSCPSGLGTYFQTINTLSNHHSLFFIFYLCILHVCHLCLLCLLFCFCFLHYHRFKLVKLYSSFFQLLCLDHFHFFSGMIFCFFNCGFVMGNSKR